LLDGAEPDPDLSDAASTATAGCSTPPPTAPKLASLDPSRMLLAEAKATPTTGADASKPSPAPVNLGLCAPGWTLIALDLAGTVTAGVIAGSDGQPVDGVCGDPQRREPCQQQTLGPAKIVGGVAGGFFALGGVLVGVASYQSWKGRGSWTEGF